MLGDPIPVYFVRARSNGNATQQNTYHWLLIPTCIPLVVTYQSVRSGWGTVMKGKAAKMRVASMGMLARGRGE